MRYHVGSALNEGYHDDNLPGWKNMSLTSAHWGTYHAHVKNGRLTGLSHFAEDSDPTEIGKGIVDVIDDDTRILGPMIRKSWLFLLAVINHKP